MTVLSHCTVHSLVVPCQVPALSKLSVADVALVRPLAGVNPPVLDKFPALGETSGAQVTAVRPQPRVTAHVDSE